MSVYTPLLVFNVYILLLIIIIINAIVTLNIYFFLDCCEGVGA